MDTEQKSLAYLAGARAAKAGININNCYPYIQGKQHQDWLDGYHSVNPSAEKSLVEKKLHSHFLETLKIKDKTINKIAADKYPITYKARGTSAELILEFKREGYEQGYADSQQSQPMWREIEAKLYYDTRYMRNKDSAVLRSGSGWELLRDGYTHYLSSEDLLKLPTEKK